MNTSESQILELVRQGEGLDLEFKACRNQLNRDVFETVCAFLNRHGGTMLLGVQDDGTVSGIDPDALRLSNGSSLKRVLVATLVSGNWLRLFPLSIPRALKKNAGSMVS